MNKNYLILLCSLLLCNSFIAYSQLPQIIITIAGNGYGTGTPVGGYSGDSGPATAAMLSQPSGVTLDDSNNLYIADRLNNRIRKTTLANGIIATGTISTVFGNGTYGFSGDGGPATAAQLEQPTDICRSISGNFYIADEGNYRIRMVNASGVITTIAGNGINGYYGDGGPATNAKIGTIEQISVDVLGNIYIGDQSAQRIRKINSAGIITTIAGNGTVGFSGDGGPATSAELNWPRGTCTDRNGNLYIADFYNNRIRKVDTFGIITTIAGIGGVSAYSGDGGPATMAQLGAPHDVVVDSLGNIYIGDCLNFCVRKVDTFGIITTVAGTGLQGYSGDNCAATAAQLHTPEGLTTDGRKFLYISDNDNHRIRRVGPDHPPSFTHGHNQYLTVCAGVTASIDTFLAVIDSDAGQQETWTSVIPPVHGTVIASYATTSTGDTLLTAGLSYTPSFSYSGTDSFKIRVYDCVNMADTTTVYVTVNPLPNVGSITGPSGLCVGANITLTDLAVGGIWSSSSPGIATVGTTGIVTGLTAGITTISYSATNSCGTIAATKIITVSPFPSAGTISGSSVVCAGASIILSDPTAGGVWSSSAISIATVGSSGTVTGVSAGIAVISYSVANSCGSASATRTITVNASPSIITGTMTVCVGATTVLGNTVSGGIWSSSNPTVATIGSGSGIVTGLSAGTVTVTYSLTGGCITTAIVSVNPLPNADTITGPSTVCIGAGITLIDAAPGGIWNSSAAGTATVGSTGIVTGITIGIAVISYTVTNSCGTATTLHIVTVNTLPSAGTITGASILCAGSAITLTNTTTSGTWSSSLTGIATVGSTGIVTGVATGVATIIYTVTNSCGTTTAVHPVTINPLPFAGSISGPSNVCFGATITLTDPIPGGTWSSGTPVIASIGSTGIVTGLSAGMATVSYSVTNSCGTDHATKIITVIPLPNAGIITGNSTIHLCVGSTILLTDTVTGGTWSSSNTRATVSAGLVTGTTPGPDTISYTITNACGTAIASRVVTVNASPFAGTITGSSSVCQGAVVALADAATGGVWSSAPGSGSATVSSSGIVNGIVAGMDTIKYTVTDTLCSATAIKIITINPLPDAGTITGPSSVCEGATITLADTAGGGMWNISNGTATISAGLVTGFTPGIDTISYTVTNSCGIGIVTKSITVMPMPVISGTINLCVGATTLLNATIGGGIWSSGDSAIATVTGSTGMVTGKSAGTVIITYAMGCTATKTVTINPMPDAGIISGSATVCKGATFALNETVGGGKWNSGNISIVTIDSTSGIVTSFTTGTVTITYTIGPNAGGCINSATYTLTILPDIDFIISSNVSQIKCYGDNNGSITVTVTGGSGDFQYEWSNGDTSTALNNLNPGIYTLKVKELSKQCNETDSFDITQPDSLAVSADIKNDYCKTGNGSISVTVTGGTAPYSYLWSNNASGNEISGLLAGTYGLSLTDMNNCFKKLSVLVEDSNCTGITVHDGISPNGDGINDTWIIDGIENYPSNKVQVFDKWGDMVFEEVNYKNDWIGKGKNGSLLPDGTYYYLIKLNASNSTNVKDDYTGSVLIKR